MVVFKHFEIELLKIGKVIDHITKVGKKIYPKSKIYLNDGVYSGKQYELYNIGDVCIEEVFSNARGKGILIFIPDKPRKKEIISQGNMSLR